MDNILLFVLSSWGMTQILVYGKIFDKIRPTTGWLGELLSCSMCTGFWVGVFLWALSCMTALISFDYSLVTGILLGCISSATSYALCSVFTDYGITFFGSKEDETTNKDPVDDETCGEMLQREVTDAAGRREER